MTEEQAKTATLDELRDWLAEADGWHYEAGVEGDPVWCKLTALDQWNPSQSDYPSGSQYDHPFPPTLDGAAAAIPANWAWWIGSPSRLALQADDGIPRRVKAFADSSDERTAGTFDLDELTARYRLAVLCRLADREEPK